jgi:hypothetical protein
MTASSSPHSCSPLSSLLTAVEGSSS